MVQLESKEDRVDGADRRAGLRVDQRAGRDVATIDQLEVLVLGLLQG
jgi:hypothetical protein